MQKIKTLAAIAALFGAVTAQAAMPSAIVFDGYCDGITDIMTHEIGTVTGTWSNNDCVGGSAAAVGLRTRVSGAGMGQTGQYVHEAAYGLVVRINDNGTWTYYDVNGNYFNGGTWSDASAARVARGSRPSVQR